MLGKHYIRLAGQVGSVHGPGRRNLRAARREIGELKKAVARLAKLTSAGLADHYLDDRTRDMRDTLALVKEYVRLSELQIELGMSEHEARKDKAGRLTADEIIESATVDPTDA